MTSCLLEALRDGREVLLVPGDQRRVGLGTEAAGKIKRAGSPGIHGISSDLRSRATSAQQGAWTGGTNPVAMTGSAPPEWIPWPLPVQVARACRLSCSGSWLDDPAWFTRALAAFPGYSYVRRFCPRPAIMRHDPGLAASPPVRYILKMEGSGYSPPFDLIVRCGRTASSRSGGAPRTAAPPARRISHGPTDAAAEREVLVGPLSRGRG